MNDQEQHIVALLQQKDQRAIELLYDSYAPALFGIVLKIVHCRQSAEDVVQEVFVKVWKNGHKYHAGKGRLFTWLLNIARNTAIDQTRSAAFRRRNSLEPLDVLQATQKQDVDTLQPEHIGLKDLVNDLDKKYREVIDLIYFQGFSQQEVKEELNIPLGTVKSRTRIAIRELRSFFNSQEIGMLFLLALSAF